MKDSLNNTSPVLELSGINKTFTNDLLKKNHKALDDIHLKFPKGQCTGLLGHNGAGKTTCIRIILGIIYPDSGQVLFNGKPINTADKALIGYMPEVNKLAHQMTPIELLRSHIKIFTNPSSSKSSQEDRCQKLLNQIGLWEHRNKKVKNLSKGMGRRIAWALAIIHEPQLLILDEPFSGLDPLGRNEMTEWIEQAKESGTSIILCTHELWSVHALCHNIRILNSGKLVYSSEYLAPDNSEDMYEITLSGTTEDTLNQLKKDHKLANWSKLDQDGWLSRIAFNEYEHAMSWLTTCHEKGFLILKFSSDSEARSKELLSYFSK